MKATYQAPTLQPAGSFQEVTGWYWGGRHGGYGGYGRHGGYGYGGYGGGYGGGYRFGRFRSYYGY
jgi:hypothetical protein